jgi:hypothetical protein
MKKIFGVLIVVLFLFPRVSLAQTSCSPVTADTYSFCCGTAAGNTNIVDCKAYRGGYAAGGTPTTTGSTTPSSTTITTPITQPAQPMCRPVTDASYNVCCGVGANNANAIDCKAYQNGYATPAPYTPGGGVPSTGAFNPGTTQSNQAIVATPQAGSAQLSQCSAIKFISILDILIWLKCIIVAAVLPLIFSAALLFFLWGVMKFIGASDSTKKEEGKKFIVAGLIGLFVMTGVWGIVKIVGTTFGLENTVPMLQTDYLKK